jgi:hypothetical protein
MLISPIDRNKGSEPEKQVSRINSTYWTLPINGGLGSSKRARPSHPSEGIILRVRDTRLMERRKIASGLMEPERRKMENRKYDSRWNPVSHHILVIAIERKAGEPEPWRNGDQVSVVPKAQNVVPQPDMHSSSGTKENKPPLLVKDEEDYVVHLSGKSPKEIR